MQQFSVHTAKFNHSQNLITLLTAILLSHFIQSTPCFIICVFNTHIGSTYYVGYSLHYQNIHAKKSGKENKGRG